MREPLPVMLLFAMCRTLVVLSVRHNNAMEPTYPAREFDSTPSGARFIRIRDLFHLNGAFFVIAIIIELVSCYNSVLDHSIFTS